MATEDKSRAINPEDLGLPSEAETEERKQQRPQYRKWLIQVTVAVLTSLTLISVAGKRLWVDPIFDPSRFVFAKETTTLIIGASHSAMTFDPDDFPGSINVSTNGEPVFFTYYKARWLLKNNPQLERVLVAVAPIHVAKYQDDFLFGGSSKSRTFYLDFFYFLDDAGRGYLEPFSLDYMVSVAKFDLGIPLSPTRDVQLVANHLRGTLDMYHFDSFQGFLPVDKSHLTKKVVDDKIRFYFLKDGEPSGLSAIATQHVLALGTLTKEHGVDLIVVNTPMHASFRAQIPEVHVNAHRALIEDLTKHDHVRYLDFSDVELPDSSFTDGDHLNVDGIRAVSPQIRDVLMQ